MTKEEAIEFFEDPHVCYETHGYYTEEEEIEANNMAISVLKGGWIPIEEREPNNYEEALVCTDTEEIFKATYYTWEGFDDDNGNAYSGEIIAWQPLPEPYKKGEKDA